MEKIQGEYLPLNFKNNLLSVYRELDLKYPIYRHSSCAVSYIISKHDYNGTMFRDDICFAGNKNDFKTFCSKNQLDICNNFKSTFNISIAEKKLKEKYPSIDYSINDHSIQITNKISQEELIDLIHYINYPLEASNLELTNQYVGSIININNSAQHAV